MEIYYYYYYYETLRDCIQFKQNDCRFEEWACWFKHLNDDSNDDGDKDTEETEESELVFQKVSENLKPPFPKKKQNQN